MAITTRMITKGIPPRLHDPKPTGKPRTKKSNTKTATMQGSFKWAIKDSDNSENEELSSGDDSESARRAKKKAGKQQRLNLPDSDEVEVADDSERWGKDVEEVDDGVDDEQSADEQENDGLDNHQCGADLQEKPVKKESMLNLLTIMTDKVTMKFKISADEYDTLMGRWCTVCKGDEAFVKAHGKCKAFHKGGNSSCRAHIRQHFDLYKQKCEKEDIPMSHWAIPHNIWKTMEEEKEAKHRG
ncbi:uncharacterized protein LACBIDRAFT_312616 [Laccaria bicolor S238N-H82]|uniref:Predicted protein n=1 Tax=Laccaria bicolor (strain S238N-H82 / ATCC MYA-4686) TaxID=486041 RepID=B0DWI3_LACBS|nr:uncharacterized protein LACBIDRAFT_312616 [Laccaria bicolor S238N-H82]EDR01052.1 predicted protein [Laccaria bicolor S238N-H82]|eukprot:XP_001888271.1 predicted protein [Laccaria bicolor S238N-H82]